MKSSGNGRSTVVDLYKDRGGGDNMAEDLKKITPTSTEEITEHPVLRSRRGSTHTKKK